MDKQIKKMLADLTSDRIRELAAQHMGPLETCEECNAYITGWESGIGYITKELIKIVQLKTE